MGYTRIRRDPTVLSTVAMSPTRIRSDKKIKTHPTHPANRMYLTIRLMFIKYSSIQFKSQKINSVCKEIHQGWKWYPFHPGTQSIRPPLTHVLGGLLLGVGTRGGGVFRYCTFSAQKIVRVTSQPR